jgi:hypothetical protein
MSLALLVLTSNLGSSDIMTHANKQHNVLLRGKVIETYEKGAMSFAKISVDSCIINMEMEGIEEAHLGDKVSIEADISFKRTKKRLNPQGSHTHIENADSSLSN